MTAGCDGCTMCCKLFAMQEFNKPVHEWCKHCNPSKGCNIYPTRPQTCVDYECLWLQSQSRDHPMVPELKPNRCKVIFEVNANSTMLVASLDQPGDINRPEVVRYIQAAMRAGLLVYVRYRNRRYIYGHKDDTKLLERIEAAVGMATMGG